MEQNPRPPAASFSPPPSPVRSPERAAARKGSEPLARATQTLLFGPGLAMLRWGFVANALICGFVLALLVSRLAESNRASARAHRPPEASLPANLAAAQAAIERCARSGDCVRPAPSPAIDLSILGAGPIPCLRAPCATGQDSVVKTLPSGVVVARSATAQGFVRSEAFFPFLSGGRVLWERGEPPPEASSAADAADFLGAEDALEAPGRKPAR